MTGSDVRNLMRHHSSQLGFIVGGQNQSTVHVEETARQRKGVHLFGIEHLNREGHARVGVAHQILADAIDVFGDNRIGDHSRARLDLPCQLASQRHFAFERVEVKAAAGVALSDEVDVVFGRQGRALRRRSIRSWQCCRFRSYGS